MLCNCSIKGFEFTFGASFFFWVSLQCCVVLSSCSFCFIICSIIPLCYCCCDFLSCFILLLLCQPLMFHVLLLWKPFVSLLLHLPFVLLLLYLLFTLHIIFVVIFTLRVHISHYCCCAFLSSFTLPLLPFMYMFLHNVHVPFLCTSCC